MEAVKFLLIGSSGRMGTTFKEVLATDEKIAKRFQLVAEVNSQAQPTQEELRSSGVQVAIDFSQPQLTLSYASKLAAEKIPHLIATTGFSEVERGQLGKIYTKGRWLLAPNTSFGVHLMKKAITDLLKDLSTKGFKAYLYDTHHRFKKDSPSGTALSLAESIQSTDPGLSLELHAARGGHEVGEHRLVLLGPGEKLEITHQASDRSLFVYGAFELAEKLLQLPERAEAYSVADAFQ